MSSNRKFQFKSRVRFSAPQSVLRNISTETLYSPSSPSFDDNISEFSISIAEEESEPKSETAESTTKGTPTSITIQSDDIIETTTRKNKSSTSEINQPMLNKIDDEQQPTTSSINLQTNANHMQTTRIVIEKAESSSSGSVVSLSSAHFEYTLSDMDLSSRQRLPSFTSSREEDVQSQLSFIVKERLHEFTRNIRRRTSQVREELIREPTPDLSESEVGTGRGLRHQASLMSLIGLREETFEDRTDQNGGFFNFRNAIDPFGRRYTFWLFFVVMALLYNAFIIPLRSSYPYQTDENLQYWLIVDYACDLLYYIDMIIIKPRLAFMRNGIAIREPTEMRRNYLRSKKFKLDLISLMPLDLLYFVTGPICAWRVVRLFKFLCFWEFFDLLDSSFSNPYIIRIAKTFSYMIYIIHCNSCIYYMLSAWQAFGQIPYVYKGKYHLNKWVYNNEGNAYIRCFYFTAAVATSTGNNPSPTNVIEYIYMTFSWMMGVFVFALLLGQIRDIVYNANKNNEEFRSTMDKALGECKRLDLPENLTARVRSWFLYTWDQQKTLDEKKLVEKLPLKLQTDLALSVHYGTLSKVQLFQDADRALLRDLVLKLKPVIFLPGDMICKKGDVGKEMYIVNNGILEVVGGDNNEQIFATLSEGSVFGEISLLAIGGNNRRTANIRSKGYSTLFVLSKEDLNDVINDYPDAQILMRRKARQLLQQDVRKRDTSTEAAQARRDLVEKCRISSDLRTPRIFEAVTKLMPPNSTTSKILSELLEKRPEKNRNRLKRRSTIPTQFSDISESDFMPDLKPAPQSAKFSSRLAKTHSLDVQTCIRDVPKSSDSTC